MTHKSFKRLFILSLLALICLFFATPVPAVEKSTAPETATLEKMPPDRVDSVLAKLSDEQVRSMLLQELSRDLTEQPESDVRGSGLFRIIVNWLHVFDVDSGQDMEGRIRKITYHLGQVPQDLRGIFLQFGDDQEMGSALRNTGVLLAILLAGLVIVLLFKKLTANLRRDFMSQAVPQLSGYMRLWAGIIRQIPTVVDIAIYVISSLLLFILTPLSELQQVRYLFMAMVFSILFIRISLMLSHLFCSPGLSSLRLLPLSDAAAEKFHKLVLLFSAYVGIGMSLIVLLSELGMQREGLVPIVITLGSILLLLTAGIIVRNRQQIAEYILSGETVDIASNWVMRQFASLWHIPALLYLFIVWLVFLYQQVFEVRQDKGAFLLSLLVVPLFLLLDRIGQWVVQMTVSTLKIYKVNNDGEEGKKDPAEPTPEQQERLLVVRVGRMVRLAILLALGGWVMSLWGYQVPYVATITKIVFNSLVTLALALAFWKVLSSYIEKKITEDEPQEELQEEQDDEWGGAAQRGRSYTLLPVVRKFIGTVLVVMVTLIILSTIGIEIGPLLAGAGVVGLAIGFGAQKLVSDIFSGFFYLLDDAFRVGEYLEAGGVSGAVEGITLRNVMLRHHRGMLQIVPYSELGPITNYMRGGIVVKFNLEFPYGTNIDKVRKIIKKVGQSMLEDEEFGKDFIRPVKSQGVREITNSVMVIRVKFTAKPGTHFVIRREAYRRITEALAAKGIRYAHRKVIVELPDASADTDKQKIAEAGAAACLAAMAGEEKKSK